MPATGGPRRGLPDTAGSDAGSSAASFASPAGESASPARSGMVPERSRMVPEASSSPGFSPPGGP